MDPTRFDRIVRSLSEDNRLPRWERSVAEGEPLTRRTFAGLVAGAFASLGLAADGASKKKKKGKRKKKNKPVPPPPPPPPPPGIPKRMRTG